MPEILCMEILSAVADPDPLLELTMMVTLAAILLILGFLIFRWQRKVRRRSEVARAWLMY